MSKEIKFSTFYIELDCLLDTRMSTLFNMGEDICLKAVDGKYNDRITDHLPGIDYNEFKKQYDAREKSVLKNAMVTPMINVIRSFSLSTAENTLNSPFHYEPKVVLNVFPYDLDDDEKKLLSQLITKHCVKLAQVEVISRSPEQVTPLYVKNHLSIVVMYRYDEWLEIHCANGLFPKTTIPSVSLLGPRVSFKKLDGQAPERDPFKDMEEMASPLIKLNLLPASMFSMVLKLQKKQAA